MTIQLVFLARLRERFGVAREVFICSPEIQSVNDVLIALRARGGVFAAELAAERAFRVALNQEVVTNDHPVCAGDELAIFPPVTGG